MLKRLVFCKKLQILHNLCNIAVACIVTLLKIPGNS